MGLVGASTACFVGDQARGLPCETNDDCGLDLACVVAPGADLGCCGEACAATSSSTSPEPTSTSTSSSSTSDEPLCGNGFVDAGEECDPNETGGPPCTNECRLCGNGQVDDGEECDPAEQGGPSCTDECSLCGNGQVDEGEECDDTGPGGTPCSPECTLCGNNQLDEGEECDDAGNDNCVECQYASACGNGVVEPDEGEVCDEWGLPANETCTDNCRTWTYQWTDAESPKDEFCRGDDDCLRWVVPEIPEALRSGPYVHSPNGEGGTFSGWPEAVLRTRPLEVGLLEGAQVRVELQHRLELNSGESPPGQPVFVDHADVVLEQGSDVRRLSFPGASIVDCSGTFLGSACLKGAAPPFCTEKTPMRRLAGTLEDGGGGALTSVGAHSVTSGSSNPDWRLRFSVRYDCGNFTGGQMFQAPLGWNLEGVTLHVELR